MKRCPHCDSTYADSVKFCARDGHALVPRVGPIVEPVSAKAQRCPTCGAEYDAGRFCAADGSLLVAVE